MKKIISSLMMIATMTMFAQKPYKIAVSSEIELQNKSYADNIVSYETNGVCMITSKNKGIGGSVAPDVKDTKFNLYRDVTFQKTVDLKPTGDGAKYIETYNNDGKLCFIDASYNKSKGEIETYYREVDNNGAVKKSILMNNIPGGAIFLRVPEYLFKTVQSPNNKKILNIATLKDKNKKTEYVTCFNGRVFPAYKANGIKVGVVDENGSLLFKKEISVNAPAECDKISIEDYKINDAGDVFLMVKQYIKGKLMEKQTTNYIFLQ